MMPPSAQDAARRLLILLSISSHAVRLMMVWDFTFRTVAAIRSLTGQSPSWRSLGLRGEWLKLRANWNWFWERRTIRDVLTKAGLFSYLTTDEHEFLQLDCQTSQEPKRASVCGRSRRPLALL